jgi:hypothetical protein
LGLLIIVVACVVVAMIEGPKPAIVLAAILGFVWGVWLYIGGKNGR